VKKILALKKSGNIKLALYLHDLLPLQHPEFFSYDLVWKYNNFVPLIEVADIILVSNNDVKSEVEDLFKKSHIKVVALPATFEPPNEIVEPALRFLAVGTIEPRKNYVAILNAFEKLHEIRPDVELRIVGNIGWKYTEIVTRISQMKQRGIKIQWLKNLDDEVLQREYQSARAVLYPSHYEGYGLPILEALSQSTPVITSDRPAMRLFARFGGVSLINPDNPDELFTEMRRMLDVDYRNAKTLQIRLDQIPTSWSIFTEQCFQSIKEV
jgi:glycosyltransferase involved in cell wall biosynthesis